MDRVVTGDPLPKGVSKLLGDIEARARETLGKHRDALEALAEALMEQETLEAVEIREILKDKVREGPA